MSAGVTVQKRYEEPGAHALRERYVCTFGGAEMPVALELIVDYLLGPRVEHAALVESRTSA